MKKTKIVILQIIFLIGEIYAQGLYYEVDMFYDKETINIKNVKVILSQSNIEQFYDSFIYNQSGLLKLIDLNDKEIQSINFGIPNFEFFDTINESGEHINGGKIIYDNVSFKLYIPHNENANFIFIYDNKGELLDKKDISFYSKNYKNILDEKKDKEKIKEDNLSKFSKLPQNTMMVLLITLFILISILIISMNKKKKKS